MQRLPIVAAIEGDEHAGLQRGEDQIAIEGVFADRVGSAGRQPVHHGLPRFAVIAGAVNARRTSAAYASAGAGTGACSAYDGECAGSVAGRRFQRGDAAGFREIARGDVIPVAAAIARKLDQAIGGACPDDLSVLGRKRERADGWYRRTAAGGIVARRLGCLLVGRGEIGAGLLPMDAFVVGGQQILRRQIKRLRIERREPHGRRSAFMIFRRPLENVLRLAGGLIDAQNRVIPAGGVEIIRIGGVGDDARRFESVGGVPIAIGDLSAAAGNRRGDGAAVLLRRIEEEREAAIWPVG